MMLNTRTERKNQPRKGAVAVLVAVLLVVVVGMLALVLDGGLLRDDRRGAQAAADAAALAAASELFTNYPSISTTTAPPTYDPKGAAAAAAQSSATTNGFPNDNTNSTVQVNIPPTSGPFAGQVGCVEVIVTYYQKRYFSTIYGSTTIPVKARAVARARYGGTQEGIVILDPSADHSLDGTGSGSNTSESVNVTGGAGVYVNSSYSTAARTGGGGSMSAASFNVVGGYTGSGFSPTPTTGTLPVPDPLRYLPQPSDPSNYGTVTKGTASATAVVTTNSTGTTTVTTTTSTFSTGAMTTTMTNSSSTPTSATPAITTSTTTGTAYLLTAGKYGKNGTALPAAKGGDVVLFTQQDSSGNGGIYYIDGGGWSLTNSASLQMAPLASNADPTTTGGILIYNAPASTSSSESISINGSGMSYLTALKQGSYAGILFWQDRNSTVTLSITGSSSDLEGTFYAAGAQLKITGSGTATIGSQYISRTLNISGSGSININYSDSGTARLREVMLVE
jgi:hypothetical protein